MVGVIIAVALSGTALYFQIGDDVLSGVTKTFNPCLEYYDTFADELKEHGVFQSDSTKEQNVAFYTFVAEDCFSTVDLWMPNDREMDKAFVINLKSVWESLQKR